MDFNRWELKLTIELITERLKELESQLSIQEELVYDLTERGEDTEVTYNRIREIENLLATYETIAQKFEAMKEGCKY